MKILIITHAFLESTIPLAKNLNIENHNVDLLVINYKVTRKLFVFDFSNSNEESISKNDLKGNIPCELFDYLGEINLQFEFFSKMNSLSFLKRMLCLRRKIINSGYDVIHIIQGTPLILFLASIIPNINVIFTLHEVCSHTGKTPLKQKVLLNYIILRNLPLILHSNASKERFHKLLSNSKYTKAKIRVVYFGLFELYNLVSRDRLPDELKYHDYNAKKLILYYGRITPDKGLTVLIDAFRIVTKIENNVHLVIAGVGNLSCKTDDLVNFTFINRYLTNEDIVSLNRIAYLVVCPYLSASQSGIPMTSFVFQKPVIASNVGAFPEVILNNETGILVEKNNPNLLASSIIELIQNNTKYNEITDNISMYYNSGNFNWSIIAKKTITIYKESVGRRRKIKL